MTGLEEGKKKLVEGFVRVLSSQIDHERNEAVVDSLLDDEGDKLAISYHSEVIGLLHHSLEHLL